MSRMFQRYNSPKDSLKFRFKLFSVNTQKVKDMSLGGQKVVLRLSFQSRILLQRISTADFLLIVNCPAPNQTINSKMRQLTAKASNISQEYCVFSVNWPRLAYKKESWFCNWLSCLAKTTISKKKWLVSDKINITPYWYIKLIATKFRSTKISYMKYNLSASSKKK